MSSFKINNLNGAAYYTSQLFDEEKGLKHFFSSKKGGYSTGQYSSLNLGVYTDDDSEHVKENMDRVFVSARMTRNSAVYLKQVHGNAIYEVTKDNVNDIRGLQGDGLITAEKNLPIGIFTADCVPILLFDRNRKIAAALHGGWKGTEGRIVEKAVDTMCSKMGSSPEDIIAAIGPSIGSCCFEVGKDVADRFAFVSVRENKFYVDLPQENKSQLTGCGVPEENISMSGICTFCSGDTLYSYRRDKGLTGRMGSFIEIV